ncbi:hypothetical protein BDV33DRAFT_81043 [Aspergillus novoparasiticus]|uniref:Uncharacterized protein n=1 Tax=Aspergillus novoparasiticus TaxID=986946 RepID=A0A5N6EWS0_9EURO|nr:hypothetical protein BDV33DRAFT_81043 [Aspergillus novoparasiticus]
MKAWYHEHAQVSSIMFASFLLFLCPLLTSEAEGVLGGDRDKSDSGDCDPISITTGYRVITNLDKTCLPQPSLRSCGKYVEWRVLVR